MNEYTRRIVKIVVGLVAVVVCLALIVWGHSIGAFGDLAQGLKGLGLEVLGLAGLVTLLGIYNRRYK